MQSNQFSQIQEFASQIPLIVSVINQYIFASQTSDTVINLSPTIKHPPYCNSKVDTLTASISIDQFMGLLLNRWEEEIKYWDEIINLKNSIYEEYLSISKDHLSVEISNFITSEATTIVNKLLELIKFDQKQMVGEFCHELLNGFESELPTNFPKIVHCVLFSAFLSPYPIDLMNVINAQKKNILTCSNVKEVEKTTSEIVNYLANYFEPKEVLTRNFKTEVALSSYLQKIHQDRKTCSVKVSNLGKFNSIILEYNLKCIEKILVHAEFDAFLKNLIPYSYENLEIVDLVSGLDSRILLNKLSRYLVRIKIAFTKVSFDDTELISNLLIKLDYITALDLSMKLNFFLIHTKIDFFSRTNLKNGGITTISTALLSMRNLNELILSFNRNEIDNNGMKIFSASLGKSTNFQKISLYFMDNFIGDEGIENLSLALLNKINLEFLFLCFSGNNIGNKGIEQLSAAMENLKKLNQVHLLFNVNHIDDVGFLRLAKALQMMESLLTLQLHFSQNFIGDSSADRLCEVLTKMSGLKEVNLYLIYNQIKKKKNLQNKLQPIFTKKGGQIRVSVQNIVFQQKFLFKNFIYF